MKKLLAVSAIAALGFGTLAQAGGFPDEMTMAAPMAYGSSDQGIYVGLSGGYGMTNWKQEDVIHKSSNHDGFVGRLFLGYDLNQYFAIEAGYTYFFNRPTFKIIATNVQTNKIKRIHVIDLVGKIKAPLTDEVNLYAKLGANYLMTTFDRADGTSQTYPSGNKSNHYALNITYGAGLDYAITPNIYANIEWMRFNGRSTNVAVTTGVFDKYQPYHDIFMIGIRYKFDI